jgi:molybdopterin/thiamine biosynthesis adenylyltransferase
MSNGPIPISIKSSFPMATHYEAAIYDEQHYLNRTQRNHYYVGGISNQKELYRLTVGVAGLGGMGGNIADALVRLGIGHLRIADPDTVEATNINRQVVANKETLGMRKVDAALINMRRLADDVEIVGYAQGVQADMVREFVKGCDIIVDEIDPVPLDRHVMLHREARKNNIPIYSAMIAGLGIHFYKFQGNEYTFEDFVNCPEEQWCNPPLTVLLERFGKPIPSYWKGSGAKDLFGYVESSGIPIFTSTVLMGHSFLVTRLILDLLVTRFQSHSMIAEAARRTPTPVMPQFFVFDPLDLTVTLEHA